MKLYELQGMGVSLYDALLREDIDQETYDDTLEMVKIELENKSDNLVKIFNEFNLFLDKKTGMIDKEIDRLKTVKENQNKSFERFKKMVTDTMLALGYETGKAKGIKTGLGTLCLTQSKREIKPEGTEVEEKYRLYKVTGTVRLTPEELNQIPLEIVRKLNLEVELNKDKYIEETGELKKSTHYSVAVK